MIFCVKPNRYHRCINALNRPNLQNNIRLSTRTVQWCRKSLFLIACNDKKSLLLHSRSSRLCALCVWLIADYDLKLYHAEFGFLLAFGTVQREFQKDGVLVDFGFCPGSALGAREPKGGLLLFVDHSRLPHSSIVLGHIEAHFTLDQSCRLF